MAILTFAHDLSGWRVCQVTGEHNTNISGLNESFIKPKFGHPCVRNVSSPNVDRTYAEGEEINVTVMFNENVVVIGMPELALEFVRENKTASYLSGNGTKTLTFSYTVEEGDKTGDLSNTKRNSLTLNGGLINATSDNEDAVLTLPTKKGSLSVNKDIVVDAPIRAFISTWNSSKTVLGSSHENYVRLPLVSDGDYNFTVDWGDGSSNRITRYNQAETTHRYSSPGVYTIIIKGKIEGFSFNGKGDRTKLINITSWGPLRLGNGGRYFYHVTSLESITAMDVDLSGTTDLSWMFRGATKFNSDISGWDVSGVTDMSGMFTSAGEFNQNLSDWDVSSVTNMAGMFDRASKFNGSISGWDVSSVTNMNSMFKSAGEFNQPVNSWNVSMVTGMNLMFEDAGMFNQPVDSWDVSSVTDMRGMFKSADAFNQPINGWDVSSVTDMNSMFRFAKSFDQNLSSWDVSNVGDMNNMFSSASSFNQPIGMWDVSRVTDMGSMFFLARAFNQDLSSWSVCQVTSYANFDRFAFKWSAENKPKIGGPCVVTVGSTSASEVIYGVGDVINITILFTRNVDVVGKPELELSFVKENMSAVYVNGSGSSVLTFAYKVQPWDNAFRLNYTSKDALKLNGGSITASDDGSPASLTLPVGSDSLGVTKDIGVYGEARDFVSVWDVNLTDGVGDVRNITLPLEEDGDYDFRVDWGDGGRTSIITSWDDDSKHHNYSLSEGVVRTIKIAGKLEGFNFNNAGSKDSLVRITSWGDLELGNNGGYFEGAINLQSIPDNFDLGSTTNLGRMFKKAVKLNTSLSDWDVSLVTNMSEMFRETEVFNSSLNSWDVSRVEDMKGMFESSSFNQDVSGWDVGSVTNMKDMFREAGSFNQSLNGWDVSSVTDMRYMFYDADSFDQPLNNWDTSSLVILDGMFKEADSFNSNVSGWDLTSVTSLQAVFASTAIFDQSLESWDVSGVTDMSNLFDYAISFNQPLNSWNVSSVKIMDGTFWDATSFNQPLDNWNTSNLVSVDEMFYDASSFNQDLSGWDVCKVKSRFAYDEGADAWTNSYKPDFKKSCVQILRVTSDNSDGAYGSGSVINLSIVFSEEVFFNGSLRMDLDSGGVATGNYTLADGYVDGVLSDSVHLRTGIIVNSTNLQILNPDSSRVVNVTMLVNGTLVNRSIVDGHITFKGTAINLTYVVGENENSADLNYVSTSAFSLLNGKVKDDIGRNVSLTLPDTSSDSSLAGVKNIAIDTVKPVVTVSPITGADRKVVSATDDDSGTTIMNYKIQTASTCDDTLPSDAVNYTEGSSVDLDNEDYNDKYVCFWSTDQAGNIGKNVSDQIIGISLDAFVSKWTVTNTDKNINLPLESSGKYNFTVNWGDGTTETVTSWDSANASHTYSSAGDKTVTITGQLEGFTFNNAGDKTKIRDITSWGDLKLGNSGRYFYGASELTTISADDVNLSGTTNLTHMFAQASNFNGNIGGWDVSEVTDMSYMFFQTKRFNQDISSWDVSSVTNMKRMFSMPRKRGPGGVGVQSSFNQPLNNWDVGKVTDMEHMFSDAKVFNQPLNNWDVSNVENMQNMFKSALKFNQDIGSWDVSSVTSMSAMFNGAADFNQPLNNWDVSNVENMAFMFRDSSFDNLVSDWNTSKVKTMNYMFYGTSFNQNVSDWDVSKVTNMNSMFSSGSGSDNVFNQPIGDWDVSSVTDVENMFYNAAKFNQNLSDWNLSGVTNLNSMFSKALDFNGDISGWDVSKITSMVSTFGGARSFNQDLSEWNVCGVTSYTGYDTDTPLWVSANKPKMGGACVVSVGSPDANGSYGVGDQINITIEFNANVRVSGTPELELVFINDNKNATYRSGSGTKILTFEYIVETGDGTLDLDHNGSSAMILNTTSTITTVSNNKPANTNLPTGSESLSGVKDLLIDGMKPVITVSDVLGFTSKTVSATDEDITSTTMKYFIQSSPECDNNPHPESTEYTESVVLTLKKEDYNGKHACFWSTDQLGNVGNAASAQINGISEHKFKISNVPDNQTTNLRKLI